jgi:tripartite ATP-independent transporter DctP family solute receptor
LKLAEFVKDRSAGRLEIKVYPNEQLGKELDMINGMRGGTVDMTITGESLQNWTSLAGLCAVPYAIRDSNHLAHVAGGPIGQDIEQQILEKVGIRPIAWFERGARNLTSNRPIREPNDLQGVILRVPNVPLFIKTWVRLGAKPTPMAFSEVFTALQQGTIQAQENPLALIYSAGFYEVQKYCNLTEHVIGWIYVTVGEKQFQALPADLQTILLEAARDMQAFHREHFAQTQRELAEALQATGMIFVKADKEAFKQRAEDAVLSALTEEQQALYKRIIETP